MDVGKLAKLIDRAAKRGYIGLMRNQTTFVNAGKSSSFVLAEQLLLLLQQASANGKSTPASKD